MPNYYILLIFIRNFKKIPLWVNPCIRKNGWKGNLATTIPIIYFLIPIKNVDFMR